MAKDFASLFEEWEKDHPIINKDDDLPLEEKKNFKKEKEFIPRIDLHGMTKDTALLELLAFVEKEREKRTDKIIVIHGAGRHSEDGIPVLKKAVRNWCQKNKHLVRYYRPGREGEGRMGATVLFLTQIS